MKIALGTIFYNSEVEIRKLIQTTPKDITIYAHDGKFDQYVDENPRCSSDDGTIQYLKSQKNVKLFNDPNLPQWEKRNRYLVEAEKDGIDLLIVADSDHYFIGNWADFIKNAHTLFSKYTEQAGFCIPLLTKGNDGVFRFVHVSWIYRPSKVRYSGSHDNCVNQLGYRILPKTSPIINGILMVNDHTIRTQTRTEQGINYKLVNRRTEGKKT